MKSAFLLPHSRPPSILECRADPALQAGPGSKPLIASLPVPLHESTAVLVPAALGAIGGLYSFFHGFSILQQQRPLPIGLPTRSTVHHSTPVADAAGTADLPKPEPRTEVIQLSPEDSQVSSVLMTQQGKIAAALLKAGIPSPATWTDESTSVRVEDPPSPQASLPPVETKVSVAREPSGSDLAFPELQSEASQSAKQKAMLFIWGGPVLTLACIYFLVAHLGWL